MSDDDDKSLTHLQESASKVQVSTTPQGEWQAGASTNNSDKQEGGSNGSEGKQGK